MSQCFARTLELFSDDSQGSDAWLAAILKFADSNHDGADVLANPYIECIRRFEAAGVNPHALAMIRDRLSHMQLAFDRGDVR